MILYRAKYRRRRKRRKVFKTVLLIVVLILAGLAVLLYVTQGQNIFMPSPEKPQTDNTQQEQPSGAPPDNAQQPDGPKQSADSPQEKPVAARAVYIGDSDLKNLDGLISVAKANKINAFIIDIKNEAGQVTYQSSLQSVSKAQSQKPDAFDAKEMTAKLKASGIMPIARLVCFKDDTAPRRIPEASVTVRKNVIWLDRNYHRWLSPYSEQAWDYIAGIADEAAKNGFEEIMLDYMQFPELGKLNLIDYGIQTKTKQQALADFAARIKGHTEKAGAKLSITVPAVVMFGAGDRNAWGEGFDVSRLSADIIAPRLYHQQLISLMKSGDVVLEGVTQSSSPLQIEAAAAKAAAKRLAGSQALRPWTQFSSITEFDSLDQQLKEASIAGLNASDLGLAQNK